MAVRLLIFLLVALLSSPLQAQGRTGPTDPTLRTDQTQTGSLKDSIKGIFDWDKIGSFLGIEPTAPQQMDGGQNPLGGTSPGTPDPGGGTPTPEIPEGLVCDNDGVRETGEACDLGSQNGVPESGCSSTCQIVPFCGDGTTNQPLEQCDKGDQNGKQGSGCDTSCKNDSSLINICGNSIVEPPFEQCDKGDQNGVPGSGCGLACNIVPCGNGQVDPGEKCDPSLDPTCNGFCTGWDCTKPDPAPLGADNKCQQRACTSSTGWKTNNLASGTSCSDGTFCNGAETCNGQGQCSPGTAPTLEDGVACTTDLCDETTDKVIHNPDNSKCDDNLFCNGAETCTLQGCKAGPAPVTSDNIDCTIDSCDEVGNKVVHQADNTKCSDGNVCTNDVCNATQGCTYANNSASCSDGDACTLNDKCSGGKCNTGAPKDCSASGDSCNTGTCDKTSGQCTKQPLSNGTVCNDDNLCTQNDSCGGGKCSGQAISLKPDDKSDCMGPETCNPKTGKKPEQPLADGTFCNDGKMCTLNDQCASGACTGSPKTKTSNDPCIFYECDGSTGNMLPKNSPDGTTCDDNKFCTTGDVCKMGTCTGGTPKDCNDSKVCTSDSCDEASKSCKSSSIEGCCTQDSDCSDGNTCSTDSCIANKCTHSNIGSGSLNTCGGCTTLEHNKNEVCSAGEGLCQSTGKYICDGTDKTKCDAQPKTSVLPDLDDSPCTDDACVNGKQVTTNTAAACEDGNICTTGDVCSAGKCVTGKAVTYPDEGCQAFICVKGTKTPQNTGKACDDGNLCTGEGICQVDGTCQAGQPISCDDNNACTKDSCNPIDGQCQFDGGKPNACGGCSELPNLDAPCSAGEGLCQGAGNYVCDGKEATKCNATPKSGPLKNLDNNACTDQTCQGGIEVKSNNSAFCDDQNSCTDNDQCSGGLCSGTAKSCDDTDPCTDDSCAAGLCEHKQSKKPECQKKEFCKDFKPDVTACGKTVCDPTNGNITVESSPDGTSCDDGKNCTEKDSCQAGQCQGSPITYPDTTCQSFTCVDGVKTAQDKIGSSCDDSDACTENDICGVSGACQGTAKSCDDKDKCTNDTCNADGSCANVKDETIPGCKPKPKETCDGFTPEVTGCMTTQCDIKDDLKVISKVPVANNTACEDSNPCTDSDKCTDGVCGGTQKSCDDGDQCTVDSCNINTGCVNTKDGNLPGCKPPEQPKDPCDGFVPTVIGCKTTQCKKVDGKKVEETVNVTDGTFCNDGSACTQTDACQAGACTGQAVICDDAEKCTTDSCNPNSGCVFTEDDNLPGCKKPDDPGKPDDKKCQPNQCDDSNACTKDICDDATGEAVCTHVEDFNFDDKKLCYTMKCNPTDGNPTIGPFLKSGSQCYGDPQYDFLKDGENCKKVTDESGGPKCILEPPPPIGCELDCTNTTKGNVAQCDLKGTNIDLTQANKNGKKKFVCVSIPEDLFGEVKAKLLNPVPPQKEKDDLLAVYQIPEDSFLNPTGFLIDQDKKVEKNTTSLCLVEGDKKKDLATCEDTTLVSDCSVTCPKDQEEEANCTYYKPVGASCNSVEGYLLEGNLIKVPYAAGETKKVSLDCNYVGVSSQCSDTVNFQPKPDPGGPGKPESGKAPQCSLTVEKGVGNLPKDTFKVTCTVTSAMTGSINGIKVDPTAVATGHCGEVQVALVDQDKNGKELITATFQGAGGEGSCSQEVDLYLPGCGNGMKDEGEECDDGTTNSQVDHCTFACKNPSCGDGSQNVTGEECDDANLKNGDGCNIQCLSDRLCLGTTLSQETINGVETHTVSVNVKGLSGDQVCLTADSCQTLQGVGTVAFNLTCPLSVTSFKPFISGHNSQDVESGLMGACSSIELSCTSGSPKKPDMPETGEPEVGKETTKEPVAPKPGDSKPVTDELVTSVLDFFGTENCHKKLGVTSCFSCITPQQFVDHVQYKDRLEEALMAKGYQIDFQTSNAGTAGEVVINVLQNGKLLESRAVPFCPCSNPPLKLLQSLLENPAKDPFRNICPTGNPFGMNCMRCMAPQQKEDLKKDIFLDDQQQLPTVSKTIDGFHFQSSAFDFTTSQCACDLETAPKVTTQAEPGGIAQTESVINMACKAGESRAKILSGPRKNEWVELDRPCQISDEALQALRERGFQVFSEGYFEMSQVDLGQDENTGKALSLSNRIVTDSLKDEALSKPIEGIEMGQAGTKQAKVHAWKDMVPPEKQEMIMARMRDRLLDEQTGQMRTDAEGNLKPKIPEAGKPDSGKPDSGKPEASKPGEATPKGPGAPTAPGPNQPKEPQGSPGAGQPVPGSATGAESKICEDGIKGSGEVCDGTDVGGMTCQKMASQWALSGTYAGSLGCQPDCQGFVTTTCYAPCPSDPKMQCFGFPQEVVVEKIKGKEKLESGKPETDKAEPVKAKESESKLKEVASEITKVEEEIEILEEKLTTQKESGDEAMKQEILDELSKKEKKLDELEIQKEKIAGENKDKEKSESGKPESGKSGKDASEKGKPAGSGKPGSGKPLGLALSTNVTDGTTVTDSTKIADATFDELVSETAQTTDASVSALGTAAPVQALVVVTESYGAYGGCALVITPAAAQKDIWWVILGGIILSLVRVYQSPVNRSLARFKSRQKTKQSHG